MNSLTILILLSILAFIISQQDVDNREILFGAVKNGEVELVKSLLGISVNNDTVDSSSAIDPNFQDRGGWSPLMIGTYNSNVDIVKFLLIAGANPNHEEGDGWISLFYALKNVDKEITRLLLSYNSNVLHYSKQGVSAFQLAQDTNDTDIIGLVQHYIDHHPHSLGVHLINAAKENNVLLMRQLLDARADPNVYNEKGWTPLIFSASNGNTEAIDILLHMGANVNHIENDGWSAIMFAAANGHMASVEVLIFYGASMLQRSFGNFDAYEISINGGHGDVATRICNEGVRQAIHPDNVNYIETAEIMRLVKVGADPNHANSAGWTPLLIMTNRNENLAALELLQMGAAVNYQENDGWTALMFAVYQGNAELVKILLDHGADPYIQSGQGHTARAIAEQGGGDVILALIDAAAKLTQGTDTQPQSGVITPDETKDSKIPDTKKVADAQKTSETTTKKAADSKKTSSKTSASSKTSSSSSSSSPKKSSSSSSTTSKTSSSKDSSKDTSSDKARAEYSRLAKERAQQKEKNVKESDKDNEGIFSKIFGF